MPNKKYSDFIPHDQPPTFDDLVGIIEKNFKDYLQSTKAFTADEIEEGWQRYKALNHLYQDESATPPIDHDQSGKEDAVAIMQWAFVKIQAWDKSADLISLADGTTCSSSQLYYIYKQSK